MYQSRKNYTQRRILACYLQNSYVGCTFRFIKVHPTPNFCTPFATFLCWVHFSFYQSTPNAEILHPTYIIPTLGALCMYPNYIQRRILVLRMCKSYVGCTFRFIKVHPTPKSCIRFAKILRWAHFVIFKTTSNAEILQTTCKILTLGALCMYPNYIQRRILENHLHKSYVGCTSPHPKIHPTPNSCPSHAKNIGWVHFLFSFYKESCISCRVF